MVWQSSTEPSSAVIYPVGPADGCNRSLFKFASEPGKQPGAQRGLARKMFTDSGCLTTVLPPSLPLTPHSPLQYNSHKNTCSCTHTCSCRLSVATLLLPLSNFSLSSHLLHTHAYIHMHTHTHQFCACLQVLLATSPVQTWSHISGGGIIACRDVHLGWGSSEHNQMTNTVDHMLNM